MGIIPAQITSISLHTKWKHKNIMSYRTSINEQDNSSWITITTTNDTSAPQSGWFTVDWNKNIKNAPKELDKIYVPMLKGYINPQQIELPQKAKPCTVEMCSMFRPNVAPMTDLFVSKKRAIRVLTTFHTVNQLEIKLFKILIKEIYSGEVT